MLIAKSKMLITKSNNINTSNTILTNYKLNLLHKKKNYKLNHVLAYLPLTISILTFNQGKKNRKFRPIFRLSVGVEKKSMEKIV